jgi:hypothetical protein
VSLFLPELERELRAAVRARSSLDAQADRRNDRAQKGKPSRGWRPSIGAVTVAVCSVLALVIAGVLLISLRSHHPTAPSQPAGSQQIPAAVRKLETKLAVLRRPQTAKDRSLEALITHGTGRHSLVASDLSHVIPSLTRYTQTLPDGREVFLVVYGSIPGPGDRLRRPPPGLAIIGLEIVQPSGGRTGQGGPVGGGGGGATPGSLYFEARHGPNGCDGDTLHNIVPDGIARIRWEFPGEDRSGSNSTTPLIVNVPVRQNVAIATIPGLVSCAQPTSVTLYSPSGAVISQIGGTHVPAPNPSVSAAQVAAPISVHALPGDGPFCGNDQGGFFYVCRPGEIPLEGTSPLIMLQVSFTARVAVRNPRSGYFVSVKNPGSCGGSGGGLGHDVAAFTRVAVQEELQTRCKGTFHGVVEYVANIGPGGVGPFLARRGGAEGAWTVGTFTYKLNALPGPTITTPNGTLRGTLAVCCTAKGRTGESGTVVVQGADKSRRFVYSGPTGGFSVALPPGRYRVVGGIPKLGWKIGRCRPVLTTGTSSRALPTVIVSSNRTTTISVVCQGQ